MDANDIAYASMMVAKDAADSSFWAAIAGIISAIASLISAGVTAVAGLC